MRLERLRLRAIGPFRGNAEVDFDRLVSSGLFLLEGPTGAGKSTLIDAVVFALYGHVAGEDSDVDRMHSDFAEPGIEPFVELEFATAAGLFRVRRTPPWDRPRRRGAGTTRQNATVKLWRLASPGDPVGELLSNRVQEADAEIARIVGLTRAQLVQTVVLPQGEFARFLRARAEERRALLQRLFGTGFYEQVQRELERMRREEQASRDAADEEARETLAVFCDAAELGPGEAGPLEEALAGRDDDAVQARAGEVRAGLARQAEVEAAALQAATRARDAARRAHEERSRRETLRVRRADLESRARALDAGLARERALRRRLDAAVRAAGVEPSMRQLAQAERRLAEASARLDADRRRLPQWAEADDAGLRAAAAAARAAAVRLEAQAELERTLPAREEAERSRELRIAADVRREAELGTLLVELPRRVEALRAARDGALARAAQADAARQEEKQASERLAAARRRDALAADRARAAEAVQAAAREAHGRHQHHAGLVARRLAGMAGELASDLAPGTPCMVCGATTHPAPAQRAADHPDARAVQEAEQALAGAQRQLELRQEEERDVAGRLAEARTAAGGWDVEAAARAAEAAADRRRAAEAAAEERAGHDEALDAAESSLREADREREAVAQRLAHSRAESARERDALATDRARVQEARAGADSVAARIQALEREARGLDALLAAAVECRTQEAGVELRREEVASDAAGAGFADAGSVQAALLDAPGREALEEEIRRTDRERHAVEEGLAAPELADVRADEEPGLGASQRALERAEDGVGQAQEREARARLRLERVDGSRSRLLQAVAARARRHRESGPVIRMANLAAASSPENGPRITLPAFVLRERFAEVVAAANQRLAAMSQGRYQLEDTDEREGGGRAGLGLRVRDLATEEPRSPETLSGGESFYVSLALALGLADVVQAEAGGVELGTLFVDEGFGTLDAATLDDVLQELGRLREGGRVVGVVSHVEELKQRIAERVEVRRLADGSSALRVVA